MKGEFTGRHMAIVLASGFGVIIAVNLLMATLALRGFGGVMVENSYVASQKYNRWLEQAREQGAYGWTAQVGTAADGRLEVSTSNVPPGAEVTAVARRPLGKSETTWLPLTAMGNGRYRSADPIALGRWSVRLTIVDGERRWQQESRLE
ncbi:FixH family protein [Croceicoccus sp. F390]|uniref:FixH family protein n=1 Tax=Croceicoccus esteveae TaxID=3075597 RepID=A0ABU2ZEB8_9SPHN|nr:FixH family protein [Croceicoccus sp. F390]MDT0574946.1 FixH family protein [Croceicoccus sp. F390]